MKTIQVSDEDYEFLKDCVNKLKTQDNRSTRSPIYTIWKTNKVYGVDEDYGGQKAYIWDDDEFESLLDIFTYLKENECEEDLLKLLNILSVEQYAEWNEEAYKELEDYFTLGNYDEEIEEFFHDEYEIYPIYFRKEDVQVVNGACFSFFEKDAIEHLQMNRHNIESEKAYTYADSLYRSPRMEKLLTMLNNLELE